MSYRLDAQTALVVVDLQNDFLPGGALPVPVPDPIEFVRRILRLVGRVRRAGGVVVATQDWHGQNDPSFKANGGIWPVHCEKGTEGADFPCADLSEFADVLIRKTEYSAAKGTGLAQLLISRGVKRVVVCGLALDYCVKATALDLSQALAEVIVPLDATAAVDPAEVQNVVRDLLNAGVTVTDTEELV